MEIRKLFGQQHDAIQSNPLKGRGAGEAPSGAADSVTEITLESDDRVSISSLSRNLLHVPQILGEDEVRRSKRVADLKKSIEDGTYQVSSQDVAQSIINFAADAPSASAPSV